MAHPPGDVLSWCEVSEAALASNVAQFRRRLAPGAQLGVVVKSNAYGHGMVPCARILLREGVDWLIVNGAAEASALRVGGVAAPVYVCGPVSPAQAEAIVASEARVAVYDGALLEALSARALAANRVVGVHLKIETGTHRQGLDLSAAIALGRRCEALPSVELEGLTTHYADIEDTTDHTFASSQLARFEAACDAFAEAGLGFTMRHSANSAATILWPRAHGTLVRVGIAAYGLWPSRETFATTLQLASSGGDGFTPELLPALSWRTRLMQVKEVPVGGYVGYGRTFRATYPMRIGVLPVGYYEGYDRRLSNLAHVLIHGVRAPVRGRVCMNMTMVDVTHIASARQGSVVTLLGVDGDESVTAEQLAGWMGSINYEVVSRIHPDQPRIGHPS